ncbi:hypothetical protein E2C01_022702 [Portunus trituberculatus]|uniref:Uncharacterized protein n=1 Tax=Portunus trituberculatus TaxID=210409 RepID=A0A5B7E622_PORTR|nr:hypothetical protein [Portunus trituberculatus]
MMPSHSAKFVITVQYLTSISNFFITQSLIVSFVVPGLDFN